MQCLGATGFRRASRFGSEKRSWGPGALLCRVYSIGVWVQR